MSYRTPVFITDHFGDDLVFMNPSSKEEEMPGPKDILIVDDTEANVAFLSQILEDRGHRFRVARNGKEAMAAMREKRPDLVLLDIVMPRKNGFAVLEEMRSDPELAKVPVIVVTAVSELTGVDVKTGEERPRESYADDLARGFGASLYERFNGLAPEGLIEKPIDPSRLIEKMEGLLP